MNTGYLLRSDPKVHLRNSYALPCLHHAGWVRNMGNATNILEFDLWNTWSCVAIFLGL